MATAMEGADSAAFAIDDRYRIDCINPLDFRAHAAILQMRTILIGACAMTKTLSFAAVHFCVAFLVGYLMTGSIWVGGALALVEPACNTVAFHLHEKVWKRIERRRANGAAPPLAV
jgi:uncharacterized membrane protein